MKRIVSAVILLSLCAVSSVLFSNNLKKDLLSTRDSVSRIKDYCINEKYDLAKNESRKLLEEWKNHMLLNTTTLKRESTEEIEKYINEIFVLIDDNNYEKAAEICETAIAETDYLLHAEQLNFENVF